MIIAALSDLHGDTRRLPMIQADLAAADMVLLTGDLTHFGRRREAEGVIRAVAACNQRILAVPGNCDYPEVEAFLSGEGLNLHRRHLVVQETAFLGLGGSLPCPGTTPNESTDQELEAMLEEGAEGLDPGLPLVLVAHQPPWGTALDRLSSGAHVGSEAIRAFIEKHSPLICFCGHIHEGRGTDAIGATRVVNPGPFALGHYAMARVSGVVERLEIRNF